MDSVDLSPRRLGPLTRVLVTAWGLGGVLLLIARALYALTPIALEALRSDGLGAMHWVLIVAWCATNAYAEGYRGFHLKFVPRVVARARYLCAHPTWLRVLLAPAFCMGLFHATRKTRLTSWIVFVAVTCLVLLMRHVPQPWRGIVDAGVVVGLSLGVVSLATVLYRVEIGGASPAPHEVA